MRILACVITLVASIGLGPLVAAGAEIPLVTHAGRPYVPLDQVAAALRARPDWTSASARARLVLGRQRVVVTRNRALVEVNGTTLRLSAPAVVTPGGWLVPEEFLSKVVPRIAPRARLVAVRTAAPPRPTIVAVAATREATVTDLRVRSYPSFTRVVIEADAPFTYRVERVRDGVLVRLEGLVLGSPRVEQVHDGQVGELRLEPAGGSTTATVTLEGEVADVREITLVDPFRLVLDFARPADHEGRRPEAPMLRQIVLDAGHGGHDAGAIGPTGLLEKDLVLDITFRVARLCEQRLGIKPSLSRSGDYFVPLADRTSFANRQRADLFVSIHANAQRDLSAAGVETYFLSSEATDIAARQVAAKENSVIELESPVARQKLDVLKTILWDLAQSEFLAESSNLAEIIQDSMTEALHIPNRGVKQAGFYVLGGAAMPAVLIEIGFVTNPKEERRLRDGRYRDEIARAIFAGIAEYKKRYDQRMRASIGD
jgi:N-acetylmuramoyl-L-alanine amidase